MACPGPIWRTVSGGSVYGWWVEYCAIIRGWFCQNYDSILAAAHHPPKGAGSSLPMPTHAPTHGMRASRATYALGQIRSFVKERKGGLACVDHRGRTTHHRAQGNGCRHRREGQGPAKHCR